MMKHHIDSTKQVAMRIHDLNHTVMAGSEHKRKPVLVDPAFHPHIRPRLAEVVLRPPNLTDRLPDVVQFRLDLAHQPFRPLLGSNVLSKNDIDNAAITEMVEENLATDKPATLGLL